MKTFSQYITEAKKSGLIELKAKDEASAKAEIIKLSKKSPKEYFTVAALFGLFASKQKKLPAQAPSDTPFTWYVKNGKVKNFTGAQHTANQKATPALS